MEAVGIVVFVLGLLLSIALHELGHLLPAKRFGVKVPEYYVGFGPLLWSRRIGETVYGIRAIPLGGYVRILGMFAPGRTRGNSSWSSMMDKARTASQDEVADEPGRAFWRLPVRKRVVVMAGGPVVNLILGLVAATIAFAGIGMPVPSTTIERTVDCDTVSCSDSTGPAHDAGILPGDRFVSVAGTPITSWDSLSAVLGSRTAGDMVDVVVERDDRNVEMTVTLAGRPDGGSYMGVAPRSVLETLPLTSLPSKWYEMVSGSVSGVLALPTKIGSMFAAALGEDRTAEDPVGVIGVARFGGDITASERPTAEIVLGMLLLFAGLNLSLFAFNLLPLLPLDGGHVAGAIFEAVRNRLRTMRGVNPAPVDMARMLPLTYVVASVLIALSVLLAGADLFNPIQI